MSSHTAIKTTRLVAGVISLALSAMINAGQATSIKYAAGDDENIALGLQKVSAQLEASKPASQVVNNL